MTIPVVLSYGMGVDSTAILLSWLHDPAFRIINGHRFDLDDLIVLTAQVGNEFAGTGHLVNEHVIPMLAHRGVRYVQVARGGLYESDNIKVLSDTHSPDWLYLDGQYRLSEEMLTQGSVPEYAEGQRKCSIKYKGWPLDTWLERELGADTEFIHVIGFNDDEHRRVERDQGYSTEVRHSEYPLLEWEWGRQDCFDAIDELIGVEWQKSCCTFCPFAGGKLKHLKRLYSEPASAMESLLIEHNSISFNPRMTLYAGALTLRESMLKSGADEIIEDFEAYLEDFTWTVYHVRRLLKPTRLWEGKEDGVTLKKNTEYWFDHEKRGYTYRSVKRVAGEMTRAQAERQLKTRTGGQIDYEQGIPRVWIREREEGYYPTVEELYVAAPAFVGDKQATTFEREWDAYFE